MHGKPTRGLTSDGDLMGISAKHRDISLHPLESGKLIKIAIIAYHAALAFFGKSWKRKEAESAEPIVEANKDNSFARKLTTIIDIWRCPSDNPPAAMDPHHDWHLLVSVLGNPHVDEKAVFRGNGAPRRSLAPSWNLHAIMTELGGRA